MRDLSDVLPRLFDLVDDEIVVLSRGPGDRYPVVWANAAAARTAGQAAGDLLGSDALDLFAPKGTDAGALTKALRPGPPSRLTLETRHPGGGTCWSDLSCAPLDDVAGGRGLTVVMRRDVTEAKETEFRLRLREAEARKIEEHLRAAREKAETAERRLHDAIDALPDGLAIYDAGDRLVHFNEAYRKIYPLSAEAMKRGASFESILRAGLAAGEYLEAIGREEDWLGERLGPQRMFGEPIEQHLAGDRFVRVLERRTEDGDRVGFRVDITEAKRTEREL